MVSGPDSTELMRRALAIACAALDEPEALRRNWAAQQCGDDATLRAEVASLLDADAAPERMLEGQLPEADLEDPWPGRLIGRYRVGARIGSGGMGTVYRAQPEAGVTQQAVALKLIKRGMDSEEILRRFLREREILARLDHPHIARLLDGGLTEDGRPWFALELVNGEPLLGYCDQRRLSLHARIELFLQVCAAVEYAHRNLIVHRDLKPGNVLVTAEGQAKLLDFGLAKLIDADGEIATRSVVAIMTPDYAAPEQYERGPITTQTDVYLLGLMLAELLSGHKPAWPQRRDAKVSTAQAHLDAPFSARGALGDRALMDLASRRASDVNGLARSLRGDLDRIARRAMSHEPERRYPSVAALADDLRRHRNGQPVRAMDDTLRYRVGKFIRRNRLAVGATLAVAASLAIGTATTWREAQRLRVAEAQTETTLALLEDVLLGADPYSARAGDTRASDLLAGAQRRIEAEAKLPPALAARLWFKLGIAYVSLHQRSAAEAALHKAVAQGERALDCSGAECVGPDPVSTRITMAAARSRLAHYRLVDDGDATALPDLDAAIADLRASGPAARHPLAQALQFLGDHEFNQGQYQNLDALSAETVALESADSGENSTNTIMALGNRASLLRAAGRGDDALGAAEQAHQRALALGDAAPPGVRLYAEQQYAGTLSDAGRAAQAEPLLRSARDRAVELRGPGSGLAIGLSWELASAESGLGLYPAAIDEFRQLLGFMGDSKDANSAAVRNALAGALLGNGDAQAAAAEYDAARAILCSDQGDITPPCLAIALNRVDADLALDQPAAARERLDGVRAAAIATTGRGSMRWHWLDSRWRLQAGDVAGASLALADSRAAMADAADAVDQANWLRLEAAIAEASGDPAQALTLLQQAEALYTSQWTGLPAILHEVRAAIDRLQRGS